MTSWATMSFSSRTVIRGLSNVQYSNGASGNGFWLCSLIAIWWPWSQLHISVCWLCVGFLIFTEFTAIYVPPSYGSDARFSDIGWLTSNQKQASSDPHYCPNCGKVYSWRKNLQRHLSLECGKQPRQRCPYCPYITNHKSSVQKHIRRLHENMPNIP